MQFLITTVVAGLFAVGGTVAAVNVVGGGSASGDGGSATVYTDK